MLTETAQVIKSDGEFVWLEPRQADQCGSCSLKKGCGHRLLNMFYDNRKAPLKARLSALAIGQELNEGDLVTVGMDEGKLLQLSALFYGLPMLMLISLVSLGSLWAMSELFLIGLSFFALLFGFYLSRQWAIKLERDSLFVVGLDPVVDSVVDSRSSVITILGN